MNNYTLQKMQQIKQSIANYEVLLSQENERYKKLLNAFNGQPESDSVERKKALKSVALKIINCYENLRLLWIEKNHYQFGNLELELSKKENVLNSSVSEEEFLKAKQFLESMDPSQRQNALEQIAQVFSGNKPEVMEEKKDIALSSFLQNPGNGVLPLSPPPQEKMGIMEPEES